MFGDDYVTHSLKNKNTDANESKYKHKLLFFNLLEFHNFKRSYMVYLFMS